MQSFNKGFMCLGLVLLLGSFSVFAGDLKSLREIIKKNQNAVFPANKNIFTSYDANTWKDAASQWNSVLDEVRTFVRNNARGNKELLESLNNYLAISTDILEGIRQYFTYPNTKFGKAQFAYYLQNKNLDLDLGDNSSEILKVARKNLADIKFSTWETLRGSTQQARLLLYDVDTALTQILQKVHTDYNKARQYIQ